MSSATKPPRSARPLRLVEDSVSAPVTQIQERLAACGKNSALGQLRSQYLPTEPHSHLDCGGLLRRLAGRQSPYLSALNGRLDFSANHSLARESLWKLRQEAFYAVAFRFHTLRAISIRRFFRALWFG
jgi:hypothetical protein